jgi:hypothetical protein
LQVAQVAVETAVRAVAAMVAAGVEQVVTKLPMVLPQQ